MGSFSDIPAPSRRLKFLAVCLQARLHARSCVVMVVVWQGKAWYARVKARMCVRRHVCVQTSVFGM